MRLVAHVGAHIFFNDEDERQQVGKQDEVQKSKPRLPNPIPIHMLYEVHCTFSLLRGRDR